MKDDIKEITMRVSLMLVLISLVFAGCVSLPEQIAEQCYHNSDSCYPAAVKTATALSACGYRQVEVCQGTAYPGGREHAWVEYVEDGERIILDPAALLGDQVFFARDEAGTYRQGIGRMKLYRSDWPDCYYRKRVGVSHEWKLEDISR